MTNLSFSESYAIEKFPLYARLSSSLRSRGHSGGYFPDTMVSHVEPQGGFQMWGSGTDGVASGSNESSFQQDVDAGLSSESFNLHTSNVLGGDTRKGLQDDSKQEIQNIMRENHVGFDEARRMYVGRTMERNAIGPDGRPRDPKAVFFS